MLERFFYRNDRFNKNPIKSFLVFVRKQIHLENRKKKDNYVNVYFRRVAFKRTSFFNNYSETTIDLSLCGCTISYKMQLG